MNTITTGGGRPAFRAAATAPLGLLLALVAGCPPPTPSGEMRISEAKWEARDARISAKGGSPVPAGGVVTLRNPDTDALLGTTTAASDGSWSWQCTAGGPTCLAGGGGSGAIKVPCRIEASAPGLAPDHRALENLPLTCSLHPDAPPPVCAVADPPADLRGPDAVAVGSSVNFAGSASDPLGRSLSFAWDFAGGADARPRVLSPGPIAFDAEGSFRATFTATTADGGRCVAERYIDVGALPTGLPPPVAQQPAPGAPGSGDGAHAVLAFNDLGMHCADLGLVPFSILPPFNDLNAEVVRKGSTGAARPRRLGEGEVELRYSAASSARDPVGPGSINSTSQNYPVGAAAPDADLAKTDFWDLYGAMTVAAILFPGLNPLPDEGLQTIANLDHGRYMPGIEDPYHANDPQPFSRFEEVYGWFTAQGIPITPVDDAGRKNSYPLMRVQAVAPGTEAVLATVDAVTPVSAEVDCRDCHTMGRVGADPAARAAGPVFVPPASAERADVETAAKTNILRLHDYKHAAVAGTLDGGPPVLCASCHGSAALSGVGGPAGDPARSTMSSAMHAFHGLLQTDESGALLRDAGGEPVLRAPGDPDAITLIPFGEGVTMEQNCFLCHPGKITQCFRGAMFAAGQTCDSCHGDMLAVGAEFELASGGDPATGKRRAWLDEPRCESCHAGAAEPRTIAFDPADPAATPILASDKRFAEQPGTLYRDSLGHGGLACESCHGSPHAIWPNPNPDANDNVAATQLQGHAGTIVECSVCHTGFSGSVGLGGPHGMHPVNDPRWIKGGSVWHGEVAKQGYEGGGDSCAACHGADHRGSRLAKVAADRVLRDGEGKLRAILPAGAEVSCGLCHSLAKSFDD